MADPKQAAKDAQLSVGATPIEEIIGSLDASEEEWAQGAALFGPGGLYADQRASLEAYLSLDWRDKLEALGTKVTDDLVKQKARADKRYTKWLTKMTNQRIAWLRLDAERNNLMLVANRGQALMRVAGRI